MPRKREPKRATKTVIYKNVPRALHDHYKAWCSLRGITMRDIYIAFIKEKIKQPLK